METDSSHDQSGAPVALENVFEDEHSWAGDVVYEDTRFHVEIYANDHAGVFCWRTDIWEPEGRTIVWPEAVTGSRRFPTLDIALAMATWKIVEAVKDERNRP